ncbi:hypothetical protein KP509_01G054600 [Ceratopteris richardii]|nr:hypothetical protein KP509_01G054600 [Ceratopteris richardii]
MNSHEQLDAQEPANVLPAREIQKTSSTCIVSESEEYEPTDCCHIDDHPENLKAHSDDQSVQVDDDTGHTSFATKMDSSHTEETKKEKDAFEEKSDHQHRGSTGITANASLNIPEEILSEDLPVHPSTLPGNESHQQQEQPFIGESVLTPHRNVGMVGEHGDLKNALDLFLDPNNQEWSDLEFGETTVPSTSMEGWHRFDDGTLNANIGYIEEAHGKHHRIRTWEHLLDGGLAKTEKSQIVSVSPDKDNHIRLPSPGNPFLKGLDGRDSFEANELAQFRNTPCTDGTIRQPEENFSSFPEEELDSRKAQRDSSSDTQAVSEVQNNDHKPEKQDMKMHLQASSSLDFMEPVQAPSFISLVDPKSQAFFGASMPKDQANKFQHGGEDKGDKSVEGLSMVLPCSQEITRSTSLSNLGSNMPGQQPGSCPSSTLDQESDDSKKESQPSSSDQLNSGFLSPNFSPLVQKVLDVVRNTPAAANGMLNSVRQAVGQNASVKKSSSGSLLTRCMCW